MSATLTGRITEIQRFCIHDGPGIRTTVFLKGCPLRCVWCHNPETQRAAPQLAFTAAACIGCGACVPACAQGAQRLAGGTRVLDRPACTACGACATACPAGALELVGRPVTVAEVIAAVERDRPFYLQSGGGLTLSGGEPLAQADFATALLAAARAAGLHTCVETCSQVDPAVIDRVIPLVDLFLCDLKETDPERHRAWTGVGNQRILANLRRLHAAGAHMRLRCPLIPGLNDREDHVAGIAALARELPGIEGVEVMPFHRLGEGKRARFGLGDGPAAGIQAADPAAVRAWKERLAALGVPLLAA
ncbi:MAG: glycyl-radical enzyme activating protein [Planctomycetes bacterium]|nr:glycyl-radical enzyme activating protein [Planctomycetota bacterium]